jgi:hypothetical protein
MKEKDGASGKREINKQKRKKQIYVITNVPSKLRAHLL